MPKKPKGAVAPHAQVVRWRDHCDPLDGPWHSIDAARRVEPVVFCTVGWIIRETDEFIVMTSTLGEGPVAEVVGSPTVILTDAILDRAPLDVAD